MGRALDRSEEEDFFLSLSLVTHTALSTVKPHRETNLPARVAYTVFRGRGLKAWARVWSAIPSQSEFHVAFSSTVLHSAIAINAIDLG
jgi:hypothetical protein